MSRYSKYMLLAKMDMSIQQDGWFGTWVGPEDSPSYEYTTGLHTHMHPELIVVGLDPDKSHDLLWRLYNLIVHEGRRFKDGDTSDEVTEGYTVRFKALPPDGDPLLWSKKYYKLDEIAALQVLWPDKDGNFPDDVLADESFAELQDLDKVRDDYNAHTHDIEDLDDEEEGEDDA